MHRTTLVPDKPVIEVSVPESLVHKKIAITITQVSENAAPGEKAASGLSVHTCGGARREFSRKDAYEGRW